MKKLLQIFIAVICLAEIVNAQSLTLLNSYQLTPNDSDSIGVFCRLMYHPARNKFYSVYAARPENSPLPQGQMTNFAWREYDANMNFTNNSGSLAGFTQAGDFAFIQVDSTYFHLTNSGPNYKLTKFNDNFLSQGNTIINCGTNDSKMDQLMNYGNNRLIIGALYEPSTINPTFPMQAAWTPQVHLFQYDTNLAPVASDMYLNPTYYSWGASAIFNNNKYYIVSMDSFPTYKLYAHEYDVNWNYLNRYFLSADGQWSQGIVWDGNYYYVAYHSGGEHRSGNIKIGIYDVNWNIVDSTMVTNYSNYPPPPGINTSAQRPFLTKVGTKLYVSYDAATYTYDSIMPFYHLNFDWQAHVAVYQINPIGINETDSKLSANIFPNPFSLETTIETNSAFTNATLTIYDMLGQEVKQLKGLSGQSIKLERNDLPAGVYFIRLVEGNKCVMVDKLLLVD